MVPLKAGPTPEEKGRCGGIDRSFSPLRFVLKGERGRGEGKPTRRLDAPGDTNGWILGGGYACTLGYGPHTSPPCPQLKRSQVIQTPE